MIAVPDKSPDDGTISVKYFNVNNIAQRFAEIPNSFNIFLIEACRIPYKGDITPADQEPQF